MGKTYKDRGNKGNMTVPSKANKEYKKAKHKKMRNAKFGEEYPEGKLNNARWDYW